MLTDYQLALQCQQQYDGLIPLRTVAEVDYSVVHSDGIVDLIFQGTANWRDAQRDLEAEMVETGWGRVHAGALAGVPQVIDAELDNFSDDILIRCSGHSLGSMEAALAKRVLYQSGFRNLEAIGFEPPHYGDAVAVAYSGNDNERAYQNYKDLFVNDIFTMIPPHLLIEPYVPWANIKRGWQAPSSQNEWHDAPLNIQAHSLKDCGIPLVKSLCVMS